MDLRFIGLNLRHSGEQASVKVGCSAYVIYVFIYECISNIKLCKKVYLNTKEGQNRSPALLRNRITSRIYLISHYEIKNLSES